MRRFKLPRPPARIIFAFGAAMLGAFFLGPTSLARQGQTFPLESADGLQLHNVSAAPAVLDGKKGLRVMISGDALKRLQTLSAGQPAELEQLAPIAGLEFSNGIIEAEIAGAPAPGAPAGARGFVGVAFRLHSDMRTYDAFYLRPTNGRADDQERRNHAVQYISHPDWTWARLRKETPSRYEAYVDLQPNVWTKIKIEVRGDRARLFVHGQDQPALVVNDLKTGANGKGAVALWIDVGTVAHFRHLSVQPLPSGVSDPPQVSGTPALPANLETSGMLRQVLETMWLRSRSFREQCARLERASVSIVLTRGRLAQSASASARTDFKRTNGHLRAEIVVSFDKPAKLVELIAHELEHVIEQLDGVKLTVRAKDGVFLATDTAYETVRATVIGERVGREFHTAPFATALTARR